MTIDIATISRTMKPAASKPERTTMNGKPLYSLASKSVVNFSSGFLHKLLCDGLTFSTGVACAFSCTYCYVPSQMRKLLHQFLSQIGQGHGEVVIRRTDAVGILRAQILASKASRGKNSRLFDPLAAPKVIYSSTSVDVAANLELAGETLAACLEILELTPWHIRLLSKSSLLRQVAEGIPEKWKHRLIYGFSTGTLDDRLAASFEVGTAAVSKRIEALHWLQDHGHRTFGMICPSLPCRDYAKFAREMHAALRGDRLEHCWAEPLNPRDDSMGRTVDALENAGYGWEAAKLKASKSGPEWEEYSRQTFLAHAPLYRPGQLRFLQYATRSNRTWWTDQKDCGAVVLGKERKKVSATTGEAVANP